MKRSLQISFVLGVLFMVSSCGSEEPSVSEIMETGDLEAIREKRKSLNDEQKALVLQIRQLDSAINALSDNSNLPLVTAQALENQEFIHYVELQGDVTTDQNVLIYPEVQGMLLKLQVKEGQSVRKGQLLGVIDDGGTRNQLRQMETQLDLAKTTFERQKRLWDQKIGTEIQYLEAKTNYEAQKNAVEQMRSQLSKFELRAPFAGVIDDILKDEGTVVAPAGPGSEVFRLINLSDMYIEVLVPEVYLSSIRKGRKALVYFPVLGDTLEASVTETGNYINPDNRTFRVRVSIPNRDENIKPNLTAKVRLNDYSAEEAILIPQGIISENADGDQYVYRVKKSGDRTTVHRQVITTGLSQGGWVEVREGLAAGDLVIVEGARSVRDGQEVKIL
jgi:RND family efflux transporter MFP subunit